MTYFDRLGEIPERYMAAVKFASSDEKIFTFGRSFDSREKISKLLEDGYVFKQFKEGNGELKSESVGRRFWHLGTEAKEVYHKMAMQSSGNPFYAVFGVPQITIAELEEEIILLEQNANEHFYLEKEVNGKAKIWVPSLDTLIQEQSCMLLPKNVKGYINMESGIVVPNKLFSIEDKFEVTK